MLLPECAPGARLFLVCSTQWMVGAAGRTGLRYEGCAAVIDVHRERLDIGDLSEAWGQMQTIEAAMLQADHERRQADEEARASKAAAGGKGVSIGPAH